MLHTIIYINFRQNLYYIWKYVAFYFELLLRFQWQELLFQQYVFFQLKDSKKLITVQIKCGKYLNTQNDCNRSNTSCNKSILITFSCSCSCVVSSDIGDKPLNTIKFRQLLNCEWKETTFWGKICYYQHKHWPKITGVSLCFLVGFQI